MDFIVDTTGWFNQFLRFITQEFGDDDGSYLRWCKNGPRVVEAAISVLLVINPHRFAEVVQFRNELRQRERLWDAAEVLREERRVARAHQRRWRLQLVDRVIEFARRRWISTMPPAA